MVATAFSRDQGHKECTLLQMVSANENTTRNRVGPGDCDLKAGLGKKLYLKKISIFFNIRFSWVKIMVS